MKGVYSCHCFDFDRRYKALIQRIQVNYQQPVRSVDATRTNLISEYIPERMLLTIRLGKVRLLDPHPIRVGPDMAFHLIDDLLGLSPIVAAYHFPRF